MASDQNKRIDLSLDARLVSRLECYARQHGTTPEAVLIQSVIALLEGTLTPAPAADNRKRARRAGG